MSHARLLSTALLPLLGAVSLPDVTQAQSIEYDVTVVGKMPGSYLSYGRGMNDHGDIVGMALYIPGGRKGWTWSESQGFALLPQPPGLSDYGAVDITNTGVIAGDGGGDSGPAWRYQNGTYQLLGILPGTAFARTVDVSELGSLTGTCYGNQFYYPRHSFIAVPGAPLASALDNSVAGGINDLDQVTGSIGNVAYRTTPGAGVQLLPPLGARTLTAGYSINNAGKVVGVASTTQSDTGVPFLFSDASGMQEIGSFGGRAFAAAINELDEVIGEWQPFSGSHNPWVWSSAKGLRFLNDVIDHSGNVFVRHVYRINDAGQILCDAYLNSEYVALRLDPIGGFETVCDPAANHSGGTYARIAAAGNGAALPTVTHLECTSGPAGQFGYFLVSSGSLEPGVPVSNGFLCLAAPIGRYLAQAGPAGNSIGQFDAAGVFQNQGGTSSVGSGFDVPQLLPNPPGGSIAAGQTWYFQCWFRDGAQSNFSTAVGVTFL